MTDNAEDQGYPLDPTEDSGNQGVPVPRGKGIRAAYKAQDNTGMNNKQAKRNLKKQSNRIMAQEKRRKALELRKAGASFDQIAKAVGYYDASGAAKAVKKAMDQIPQEATLQLKSMQIERLNHMLMTLWPKVQAGNEAAINTALRVMDKLDALMGTEAAQQVDVNVGGGVLVIDGNKDDYINSIKRLTGVDPNSGQNLGAPALPASAPPVVYPPGMGPALPIGKSDPIEDVVDAEVIEDDEDAVDPEHDMEVYEKVMAEPIPAQPTKKTYSFGMDPTVKRDG